MDYSYDHSLTRHGVHYTVWCQARYITRCGVKLVTLDGVMSSALHYVFTFLRSYVLTFLRSKFLRSYVLTFLRSYVLNEKNTHMYQLNSFSSLIKKYYSYRYILFITMILRKTSSFTQGSITYNTNVSCIISKTILSTENTCFLWPFLSFCWRNFR